ncbi:MAG: choice-of-anchor J domain-containing protein [Flavobacteriaceae bacterium]|nr:choice-of-anchor J domain-containing protein [Flavobacteriaceae bacterium]
MKKITLLAALVAVFSMNAQVTIWEDGFESYDDFIIENIGDWTLTDLDGDAAYGSTDYDFENENYVGVGIVFNPLTTTPPAIGTAWDVRTGDKGMYLFAESVSPFLNDDYLITPLLDLSGATGSDFSFWAKSVTADFGLERFEVLLSTTGTEVADFTVDIGGGELQAPVDYTEYTYDLSAYDGQQVYIAIHYVAQDSFVLQLDDFLLTADVLSIQDNALQSLEYSLNSTTLQVRNAVPLQNIELYNVLGQKVVSQALSNTEEEINIASLNSGLYIAQITAEGQTKSFKILKR